MAWKNCDWYGNGTLSSLWPLEAQLFDVLPDVFLFVKDRASRFVRANRAFLVMHVTGGFWGRVPVQSVGVGSGSFSWVSQSHYDAIFLGLTSGRLEQYLTSVREVEERARRAEAWLATPRPTIPADAATRLNRAIGLKHGSHIDYNAAAGFTDYDAKLIEICHRPVDGRARMSNLLMTIAQRMGVEIESFGDATGVVSEVVA